MTGPRQRRPERAPAEIQLPTVTPDNPRSFRTSFERFLGRQFDETIRSLPPSDRDMLLSDEYRDFMTQLRTAFVDNLVTVAFNPDYPDSRALTPSTSAPVDTGLAAPLVRRIASSLNDRVSRSEITNLFNQQYARAAEENPPIVLSVTSRGSSLIMSNGVSTTRDLGDISEVRPSRRHPSG